MKAQLILPMLALYGKALLNCQKITKSHTLKYGVISVTQRVSLSCSVVSPGAHAHFVTYTPSHAVILTLM